MVTLACPARLGHRPLLDRSTMATAMSMGLAGFGTATATRRGSARTSIGLVTVLISVVILGSITDAIAWGSKGHRIIGLIAQELLSPETSAEIATIMGRADLASFGLYLDEKQGSARCGGSRITRVALR